MKVLNQGENYEEDTTTEDIGDESEEDTSAEIASIAGIPIKYLLIGSCVLLVLLLIIIVFSTRKKDDGDIVIPAQQEGYVPPVEQQTPTPVQTYSWYSMEGAYVGVSSGMTDGTSISLDGTVVAVITNAGTDILQSSSGETVSVSYIAGSNNQQNSQSSNSYSVSTYTEEQIEMLKRLGYTGDEIEVAANNYLDYEALVETAQARIDEEALAALKRMSDQSSEEFQYLLNYSIYSMPYVEFTSREGEFLGYNQPGSYIVNADYEKLDTYGYQLFIKIKIANATYAYMPVTPERWDTMPATGNIVVRVNYVRYGTVENNGVYITSIVEQDITQITVNPEDTTVNFEDMTAMK